ncbi:hypothetical protein ASZ78_013350, partial [Callipepla squamata]
PLISAVKRGLRCLTASSAQEKAGPPTSEQARKQDASKKRSRKSPGHRGGRRGRRAFNVTFGHPEKPRFASEEREMTAFLKAFDDDHLLQDFLQMDRCCRVADKVMAVAPSHYIWQRERPACHSGARRRYTWVPPQPRGPGYPPLPCSIC